jgi:Beta-lactamase class C and other penicillin binding proteins
VKKLLIVERTTKTNMMDYLKPRLFSPLGIENVECQYSPEGYFYGATGMKLTVNELSRFGQLYLQESYYFWRHKVNSYRAKNILDRFEISINSKCNINYDLLFCTQRSD